MDQTDAVAGGISRRRLAVRAVAGAGVLWAAPVVLTVQQAAAQVGSPAPQPTQPGPVTFQLFQEGYNRNSCTGPRVAGAPVVGTTTAQRTGDDVVFTTTVTGLEPNANYFGAVQCVAFFSAPLHTDAAGNGSQVVTYLGLPPGNYAVDFNGPGAQTAPGKFSLTNRYLVSPQMFI